MTSRTDRASLGIQALKVFCLLVFISSLVFGIFPVHPARFIPGVPPDDHLHRAILFSNGLLLGGLFYGIQRRLAIAWTFGWVLLIVFFFELLIESLPSILRQTPDPGGWIASVVVAIGFSAVAAYSGRWWNRQKGYFSRPGF
jgi:hypothetical protein